MMTPYTNYKALIFKVLAIRAPWALSLLNLCQCLLRGTHFTTRGGDIL
jgi:hypothetical protein